MVININETILVPKNAKFFADVTTWEDARIQTTINL